MNDQQDAAPENFELMDREDEDQILQELRGASAEKFIYKNSRGDYDLSYAGTKWAVRKMAEEGEVIRVDGHPKVERCVIDPEYITVTILGRRVKVNFEAKSETVLDTNVGAARGWIKQRMKDNTIRPDDFFFNKTVSKATRNLLQILMPQDFKRRMIEVLKGKEGQRPGGGGGSRPQGQEQRAPQQQEQRAPQQGQQEQRPQGQGQAPQGQRPAQQQRSQGSAGKPDPSSMPLETVQQGFKAVFCSFASTDDKPTLQKLLKEMSGKTAITELTREFMVEVGPLIRQCIQKKLKWTGKAFVEGASGKQIWPKVQEPPSERQQESAPPPADEPMF